MRRKIQVKALEFLLEGCKGNFCAPEGVHGWSELGLLFTQPEGTKGFGAFPDHVGLVHPCSKGMNSKGPSELFLLLSHV